MAYYRNRLWIDLAWQRAETLRYCGQRYYRLLLIEVHSRGPRQNGGVQWLCECDCGKRRVTDFKIVNGCPVGVAKSCGCTQQYPKSLPPGMFVDNSTQEKHLLGAQAREEFRNTGQEEAARLDLVMKNMMC